MPDLGRLHYDKSCSRSGVAVAMQAQQQCGRFAALTGSAVNIRQKAADLNDVYLPVSVHLPDIVLPDVAVVAVIWVITLLITGEGFKRQR